MSAVPPVWAVQGLRVTFAGGLLGGRRHEALRGVDLAVAPGERLAVIGESGSGKTTLARAGLGLVRPSSGAVHLLGADRTKARPGEWRALRSRAQLLFQDPGAMLSPAFSIRALLVESARLHRSGEDPRSLAAEILEAVGLTHRADARPHELSGGERRRAGLARVLLARPALLFADEPTAGLDAALKAELLELMVARAGPDCAIVVISHDLPLVLYACTRVVVLDAGRIVDTFRPADLATHVPHPTTAALMRAAGLAQPR